MRVTILGSGSASGVPMIGDVWGSCDRTNRRNRRRRASILVEERGKALLVDTGPDIRLQLLDAGVKRLDGILFTHVHADHTHGIDEVRAVNRLQRDVIDAWGTARDLEFLKRKFSYVFDPPSVFDGRVSFYKPCLKARPIAWLEPFTVAGIDIVAFPQDHGYLTTTGFRFGDIAYSTDLVELPEQSFAALTGIETWIVGCLQEEPHPTHAHLARVLEWIERVGPKRAVLTHLSHRLDYETLRRRLPAHVEPAYDGMTVEGRDTVSLRASLSNV